jgi:adenylyltransferase/sulfurtransferase
MLTEKELNRYSRQIAYLGKRSQGKIRNSRICILGLGALGSSSAELLTRAGVGFLRIVDRDVVELSNLQRQHLFTEEDVEKTLPKAIALEKRLREINQDIRIEALVTDFSNKNSEKIIRGFNIVLDGFDNMESRFILNEACVKNKIPWVYASCIGAVGYVSFIYPEKTPCLNCFINELPTKLDTCETVGVMNTISTLISSIQVQEALKFLTGSKVESKLYYFDLENMKFRAMKIKKKKDCRVCSKHVYNYLEGKRRAFDITTLCDSKYYIKPHKPIKLNKKIFQRVSESYNIIAKNDYLIKLKNGSKEIILFKDGRAILKNFEKNEAQKFYKKLFPL